MTSGILIIYKNEEAGDSVFERQGITKWKEFSDYCEEVKENVKSKYNLQNAEFDILYKIGYKRFMKVAKELDYTSLIASEFEKSPKVFYCAQRSELNKLDTLIRFSDAIGSLNTKSTTGPCSEAENPIIDPEFEAEIINPPSELNGEILDDFNRFFDSALTLHDEEAETSILKIGKRKRPGCNLFARTSNSVTSTQDSKVSQNGCNLDPFKLEVKTIEDIIDVAAKLKLKDESMIDESAGSTTTDSTLNVVREEEMETAPDLNDKDTREIQRDEQRVLNYFEDIEIDELFFPDPIKDQEALLHELMAQCELFEPADLCFDSFEL